MRTMRIILRPWISSLLFVALAACVGNAYKSRMEQGYKAMEKDKFSEAIADFTYVYEKSSDKELVYESAKALSDIYAFKVKNYKQALRFLDAVIANSDNYRVSIEALKTKAKIQHKELSLFEAAIVTYSRILSSPDLKDSEQNEARLNLSKCYYAINKMEQARNELGALLDEKQPKSVRDEARRLEASIYQSERSFDKAIVVYNQLLTEAEDEKQKRDTLINLSLCYEQKEDYKGALEALKKIVQKDVMIEAKITQLERMTMFQGRALRK